MAFKRIELFAFNEFNDTTFFFSYNSTRYLVIFFIILSFWMIQYLNELSSLTCSFFLFNSYVFKSMKKAIKILTMFHSNCFFNTNRFWVKWNLSHYMALLDIKWNWCKHNDDCNQENIFIKSENLWIISLALTSFAWKSSSSSKCTSSFLKNIPFWNLSDFHLFSFGILYKVFFFSIFELI